MVYLSTYQPTKKKYAIKMINCQLNPRTNIENSIKQEINIMRRQDHPNVLRLIWSTKKEGRYFLVMEYCPNGNLLSFIRNHKKELNPKRTQNIARQIALGIKYLHDNDIVHRDIKPSNILLDYYLNPKIADFGCSTSL